ncbi:actin-related protein 5-like [Patiria miniata]|uniref:Actin-related protein 5 n=1 Tax=Patiria miniata TaxID=46514 RepID=A0A913Z3W3_PATMI|nr:actin-related protein 5-like [Patiria miniata]
MASFVKLKQPTNTWWRSFNMSASSTNMNSSSATDEAGNIFKFKDGYLKVTPDIVHDYPASLRDSGTPIIIDNGSCFSRVGWASDPTPRLVFRNIIARQRGKKDYESQIGNDIPNIEAVRWLLKTQFDRNVLTHYDAQELVFDHIFSRLGLDTEGAVQHPLVLTETLCNPNYCRQLMSELLFECYHVPKVAFGVDGLFSFYNNFPDAGTSDGLVLASGYQTTHILPILQGKLDSTHCKRINIGGAHAVALMHKLLQLKYPAHFAAVNLSRAEELVNEHTNVSLDFNEELADWRSTAYCEQHMHRIQLPYTPLPGWSSDDKKQDRKQQQIKRLQEINAKRREERLAAEEDRLQQLRSVQELLEDEDDEGYQTALRELGYYSGAELQSMIDKLIESIQKIKDKIQGVESQPTSQSQADASQTDQSQKEGTQRKSPDADAMDSDLDLLLRDVDPDYDSKQTSPQPAARMTFDLAEYYQLQLGVERIRVPEIIFQPSIIGHDQAGMAETLEHVLRGYDSKTQDRLVQRVFLTGGNMMYPGMKQRIEAELLAMRPFQSPFQVFTAGDPVLDAWHGAKQWSTDATSVKDGFVTREEYLEKGGEYIKEHVASNRYRPNPTVVRS